MESSLFIQINEERYKRSALSEFSDNLSNIPNALKRKHTFSFESKYCANDKTFK